MMEKTQLAQISQCLSIAGVGLAMTFSNPFELVRIRMQTMPELIRQGTLQISYKGIFDCMRRVRREEGFFAFWKGNMTNLLRAYPSQTINFTMKQTIRNSYLFKQYSSHFPVLAANCISGAVGAWISLALLYPFDYSRMRLVNDITGQSKGIVKTLVKTVRMEGIKGVYRGAGISFFGVGVFRSAYFGIFDSFKNTAISAYQRWLVGYFATMVAILLTYPTDTVRRRLMMTNCQNYKYNGFLDCGRQIYQKQGIKAFFSGGRIIFLQSLTGATVLFLYDRVASQLKNYSRVN